MRKLIVGNLVTLDGYYEGTDRKLDAVFEYFHPDYAGDQTFDHYMAERMRAADTLLYNGRATSWTTCGTGRAFRTTRRPRPSGVRWPNFRRGPGKLPSPISSPARNWLPGTTPASSKRRTR